MLRIGVSSCILHRDPSRSVFDGRPLLYMEQSMGDWITRGGAVPLILPAPGPDSSFDIAEFARHVDGIVIQGGADMAPQSYGEKPLDPEWSGDPVRDAFEIELIQRCMELNRPVLGICRGHQVVNVALGGTLFQDVTTQVDGSLQHRNAEIYDRNFHEIVLSPGSHLQHVYDGAHRATIVSVHHQAVKEPADDLIVEARSPEDDIVEAIRLPTDDHTEPYVAGVQWHPEFQRPDDDHLLDPMPLLEDFLDAARLRRDHPS